MLCHDALETVVMRDALAVDEGIIRGLIASREDNDERYLIA
jgi:hypothetical protein